ncbi:MAG: glycosyltransferase [Propionibacteriaceae bacterium]|nr:glycosyltransferase [Propionibacteriaceae bacterium]
MTDATEPAWRALRVAQFVDNYGPGTNGLTVAVQQLEGNLLDTGHEVIVVAPKAKGPNPHAGRPGRIELRLPSVRVPRMPTRVASGRRFEQTIERLAELKPDVLHVHGFGTVGALGVWAATRLKIPMLLTWHTDFDAYADHYASILPLLAPVVHAASIYTHGELVDRAELKAAVLEHGERGRSAATMLGICAKMLRSADLVTTPSPKTATRCRQLTPDANIRVVPNGVDPLPVGAPMDLPCRGPVVMYAGRIAPEKGIDLLAKAFELVALQRPGTTLLIVGNHRAYPKIRRTLERLESKGLAILAGEKKREELGAYYASADVFAFASLTDTQALVLHEAALAGLPIASVDHELQLVIRPGINGEFCRPTPASFAAAIGRVLDNLERPGWRERAAATSKELAGQWTIASQAQEMLRIYREVADRGCSR